MRKTICLVLSFLFILPLLFSSCSQDAKTPSDQNIESADTNDANNTDDATTADTPSPADLYKGFWQRHLMISNTKNSPRDPYPDECSEEEAIETVKSAFQALGLPLSEIVPDLKLKFEVYEDTDTGFWYNDRLQLYIDAKTGILASMQVNYKDVPAPDCEEAKNLALALAELYNERLQGGFPVSDKFDYFERVETTTFENRCDNDVIQTLNLMQLFSDDQSFMLQINTSSTKHTDGTPCMHIPEGQKKPWEQWCCIRFAPCDPLVKHPEDACFTETEIIPIDDEVTQTSGFTEDNALNILKNDIGTMFSHGIIPYEINLDDYDIACDGYVRVASAVTLQALWNFKLTHKTTGEKIAVRIDPERKKIVNICFDKVDKRYTVYELQKINDNFLEYLGYESLIRKQYRNYPDFVCAGQGFYDEYYEKYPEVTSTDGVYAAQSADGALSIYFTNAYLESRYLA